jgi:hypothetical protein
MADERWRSDEVLAWTEREGPGRGPAGPSRRLWLAVAGALAIVFTGIMSSDTLCPEHRTWVLLLGGAAFIAAGTAIVGLLDGWAGAPLLALLSALAGVGIGFIDAIHSPTRGRLFACGFAVVFAGACALVWHQHRQVRWDRGVAASLRAPAEAAPLGPDTSRPDNGAPLPAPAPASQQPGPHAWSRR